MSDDEEIPYDDIAHFIVQVRKLVCRDYQTKRDYERAFRRIKNLSTRLFRDHVGYTPKGGYRLKRKGERMFADAVDSLGGREGALTAHAGENPYLAKILRGDEGQPLPEGAREPPPEPLHLVPKPPPDPEWAREFDPESERPASENHEVPAALVDLEELAELAQGQEDDLDLEFEPMGQLDQED